MPLTADDGDWRLTIHLDRRSLVGGPRVDEEAVIEQARAQLGPEVVLTAHGRTVIAYTGDRRSLELARTTIESALLAHGHHLPAVIEHWQEDEQAWLAPQSVPGQRPPALLAEQEHRTLVCEAGNLERDLFEQDIANFAAQRRLSCRVVEHRHLLRSQVAFDVSGPPAQLDAMAAYLKQEARRTIRVDPGVLPYTGPA